MSYLKRGITRHALTCPGQGESENVTLASMGGPISTRPKRQNQCDGVLEAECVSNSGKRNQVVVKKRIT
jgi:hypothetical protein